MCSGVIRMTRMRGSATPVTMTSHVPSAWLVTQVVKAKFSTVLRSRPLPRPQVQGRDPGREALTAPVTESGDCRLSSAMISMSGLFWAATVKRSLSGGARTTISGAPSWRLSSATMSESGGVFEIHGQGRRMREAPAGHGIQAHVQAGFDFRIVLLGRHGLQGFQQIRRKAIRAPSGPPRAGRNRQTRVAGE